MGRIGYTELRRRMIVCTVPIFKVGDAAPSIAAPTATPS